ncbi:unnamed protein product [Mytilus coruscus]|uniref:Uncharacterized protein n=1 Tax=Mytilus coruscus TaxID=42192 RepID=A0A6J8EJ91_MYTCO|nr:unnamed protein product [Mytilus coruscus]
MNLRHQSSRDVTYSNQREITRMKDADFDLKPADSQKKNLRKQHQREEMSIKHVKSFEVNDLMTKLLQFFEKENKYNRTWYRENPVIRLAYATGFSEKTIQRHTSSGDHDAVQEVVQSLHESAVKKQVVVPKKLDDFDESVVRRTIHDMYKKKQVVTMPKLQQALKEKDIDVFF